MCTVCGGTKTASSWESKCHRCGLCCHEKAVYGRQLVIDLDSWCEHFDPATRQCKIYYERFSQSNRCRKISVWKAMTASYLPPECGYVQWARALHIRMAFPRRLRYIHSRGPTNDSSSDISDLVRIFRTGMDM